MLTYNYTNMLANACLYIHISNAYTPICAYGNARNSAYMHY